MLQFKSHTRIERNPAQQFSEIDGQVVMLNIEKESYYSLNEVGSEIWKSIDGGCNFNELVLKLMKTYNVPYEKCQDDIEPFLNELAETGIIVIYSD